MAHGDQVPGLHLVHHPLDHLQHRHRSLKVRACLYDGGDCSLPNSDLQTFEGDVSLPSVELVHSNDHVQHLDDVIGL